MITHKLNDFTIGVIEVEESVQNIRIKNSALFYSVDSFNGVCKELPKGNWQLFSTDSREVTEEQAREVMPGLSTAQLDGVWYSIGNGERYCYETALDAYNSMKVMLGVIDVNPFSDPNEVYDLMNDDAFKYYYVQWQQAQSQVKSYVVVIKKD